jgi:hypothetical protein
MILFSPSFKSGYNISMTAHAKITLSNATATRITPNGTTSGIDFTIQNVDAAAYVYIGGEDVTAANYGYRIAPNNAIAFELNGRDPLYAISSVNGSAIATIKIGLE